MELENKNRKFRGFYYRVTKRFPPSIGRCSIQLLAFQRGRQSENGKAVFEILSNKLIGFTLSNQLSEKINISDFNIYCLVLFLCVLSIVIQL